MNPFTTLAAFSAFAGRGTPEERKARRVAHEAYRASLWCSCGVRGTAPLKTWEGVPKCHSCLRKLKKGKKR